LRCSSGVNFFFKKLLRKLSTELFKFPILSSLESEDVNAEWETGEEGGVKDLDVTASHPKDLERELVDEITECAEGEVEVVEDKFVTEVEFRNIRLKTPLPLCREEGL